MGIKTKKLTEVSVLDQATEQTNLLVEHDGKTMRLPLGGLGIAQLLARIEALENSAPAPSLITFTVDGKEYQAEEGMTWGQFVESAYNPEVTCPECDKTSKKFISQGTIKYRHNDMCDDCDGMYPEVVLTDEDGMPSVSVNISDNIAESYAYISA